MSEFINTIDVLGDDAVIDSIIDRTITEFKDDQITKVGQYAFYNCTALTAVDLPEATSCATKAFYGCTSLGAADFPNVTSLGESAFQGCTALTRVNLPKHKYLANSIFQGCTSLVDVNMPEFIGNGPNAYNQRAFYGCSSLQSVSFPKLVRTGNYAFYGCGKLSHIEAPILEEVGSQAFYNCGSLKLLDLPMCKSFGSSAMQNSGVTALVLRRTDAICTIPDANALSNPIKNGTGYIYVPRAAVDSYKATTNWAAFASQIRALEDYTVDGTITGALDETKI